MNLVEDPIPKLIRRIAIPASIGFFFNTMYNFVDTYFAGLISKSALTGLGRSFPLFLGLLAVGSGISNGTTALISNALGRKDHEGARLFFAQSVVFAAISGVIVSIAGWLLAPTLFKLLHAEGEYLEAALAFMNMIFLGGVFFILQMTLNAVLNAQGETPVFRNVLIGSFVGNCLLNPLFIYGGWFGLPPLGVAGIGVATSVIQVLGAGVLLAHVTKGDLCKGLTLAEFKPRWTSIMQITEQALPAALNMMTVALGVYVITWFVAKFNEDAVAAYGIATRVEQMVLLPTIGLNFAVLSLTGQNNGARRLDRVQHAWRTCIRYGLGLMVPGGVIVYAIRYPAMRWFTQDAQVIEYGANYLSIAAITLCAYPVLFQTVFMLQGLKRPVYGLWIGLYRQIVAPLLVFQALAFWLGFKLWGVWWGVSIVNWSAALFTLWWGGRVLAKCQEVTVPAEVLAQAQALESVD
ncbi:MAG: multidrug transporter MatE [Verrucomicrobiaceae bacterium]|nr:multidrug transporter MatE [Verrucomicrobiaceae bacterium]